MNKFSNFTQ